MKKLFMTGGSGMVGRNITDVLAGHYDVVAPTSKELNLLDYPAVLRAIESSKAEIVIHCAGVVGGIQANMREPVRFLVHNAQMGMNVVNASAAIGIENLLNFASSCMYPRDAENPLDETLVLKGELEPTNEGYALAKILTERLCEYHVRENPRLKYRTAVPCNLYGRYDKFDPAHSHMVPAVIRKLHEAKLNGVDEVTVWGSGEARREFMYAGEVADFVQFALTRFDNMPALLNVGLGYDYTINEYYRTIAEIVGYQGRFIHDLTKPEGMKRKLTSVDRLKALGWTSKVSLVSGLEQTYKFFIEQELNK